MQVSVAICINSVYLTSEKRPSLPKVSELLNGAANLPLVIMDAGSGSHFRPFLHSCTLFTTIFSLIALQLHKGLLFAPTETAPIYQVHKEKPQ